MNKTNDLRLSEIYSNYYKEHRKKLGIEPYEFERSYLGSALLEKPDLKPHIDGEYLKAIIPQRLPVKEEILGFYIFCFLDIFQILKKIFWKQNVFN